MLKVCSKLTIKTPERRQQREQISHCSCVFSVDFDQVNTGNQKTEKAIPFPVSTLKLTDDTNDHATK